MLVLCVVAVRDLNPLCCDAPMGPAISLPLGNVHALGPGRLHWSAAMSYCLTGTSIAGVFH